MVHQYKLNGYNIVLDTCSGSVHTVDEVAYDIIAMYKESTKEEIVSTILEKYGDLPLVYAGGVMSNSIIRKRIESKFEAVFAKPEFSCDNAAGVAVLAALKGEANG